MVRTFIDNLCLVGCVCTECVGLSLGGTKDNLCQVGHQQGFELSVVDHEAADDTAWPCRPDHQRHNNLYLRPIQKTIKQ